MLWQRLLILAIVWSLAGPSALAWSEAGHEAIACVAYGKLTPRAKERAMQLLKLNPYYDRWLARLSPNQDRDLQIFMLAAAWPDHIKDDPDYVTDDINASTAAQNIGYSDHNRHKYWHYCDIPITIDSTPLPPTPTPNAATQIPIFKKTLASDASDQLKSYDLVWLMHVTGDVHQPLHCITRASKQTPNGDNGGNEVKLDCPGGSKDLHHFWDDQLGTDETAAAVIAVAESLPQADSKSAAKLDSDIWIRESNRLARKRVYVFPIKKGNGPFSLNDKYKEQARSLARERTALAGARLANVLNGILEKH